MFTIFIATSFQDYWLVFFMKTNKILNKIRFFFFSRYMIGIQKITTMQVTFQLKSEIHMFNTMFILNVLVW